MVADSVLRRPVRLRPNPVYGFYEGGARWRAFRGDPSPVDSRYAEDWVASCIPASRPDPSQRAQGLSTIDVPEQRPLVEVIRQDPIGWLGIDRAGGSMPAFQVKLVAPQDRVPVHSHPDAGFALANHGSVHGKAEAWIIVGVPPQGHAAPECGIGLREDVPADVFRDACRRQDVDTLRDSLNRYSLRPGDVVFIPPGIPHFIDGGTFFVEVQEPTDLGYLLEWTSFVADERAATAGLGMERVLTSLDLEALDRESTRRRSFQPAAPGSTSGQSILSGEATRFFRGERAIIGSAPVTFDGPYHVLVAIGGAGSIVGDFGVDPIRSGDTFVVPAGLRYQLASDDALDVLRLMGPTD